MAFSLRGPLSHRHSAGTQRTAQGTSPELGGTASPCRRVSEGGTPGPPLEECPSGHGLGTHCPQCSRAGPWACLGELPVAGSRALWAAAPACTLPPFPHGTRVAFAAAAGTAPGGCAPLAHLRGLYPHRVVAGPTRGASPVGSPRGRAGWDAGIWGGTRRRGAGTGGVRNRGCRAPRQGRLEPGVGKPPGWGSHPDAPGSGSLPGGEGALGGTAATRAGLAGGGVEAEAGPGLPAGGWLWSPNRGCLRGQRPEQRVDAETSSGLSVASRAAGETCDRVSAGARGPGGRGGAAGSARPTPGVLGPAGRSQADGGGPRTSLELGTPQDHQV